MQQQETKSEQIDYFRQAILNFIKQIEKQYQVAIIYATETGSRGYGTNVQNSDFDVKGFFVCTKEKYLSIRGSPEVIDHQHFSLEIQGVKYDIDFEFHDIKNFFKKKIEFVWKANLNYKFYTSKEDVYVNNFSTEDFNFIKEQLVLDLELWVSIIKGYHKQFFYTKPSQQQEQNQQSSEDKYKRKIRAKDVVNCIVYISQFLFILEKQQFPPYKFNELLKEIKSSIENQKYYELINEEFNIYMKLKAGDRSCFVSEKEFSPQLESFIKMAYQQAQDVSVKQRSKKVEFLETDAEKIFKNILQNKEQN